MQAVDYVEANLFCKFSFGRIRAISPRRESPKSREEGRGVSGEGEENGNASIK